MYRIMILILLVTGSNAFVMAQAKADTWLMFAKTKFEPKYYEKIGEYLFYPNFSAELKSLENKEVTLEGYFVPFAPENGDYVILSKYPMSQCYFCGGGGPESIAEVYFLKGAKPLKIDDLVTVKGKRKLNADDPDHVNFIIKDAVVVSIK